MNDDPQLEAMRKQVAATQGEITSTLTTLIEEALKESEAVLQSLGLLTRAEVTEGIRAIFREKLERLS